ncbi:allantoinase [Psychrosphaera saromensis]|uniref:allantoinase n=1 Tax=Psychrosphaera saromensis TaxID=716813 RepID=A0A2S7UTC3_9GAMM|nr:allantoinase AllB [Psychrosphaera saromensis]PQJ52520.1 allantoinase [Psychrosphaera saromensis]GHB69150.1 allantoinase [Psychrosphaera saromensis]GLQ12984.1 allantoinase [Psychrosphaera saromensis]
MKHFALQSENVIIDGEMKAACIEVKDQLIFKIHPYGQAPSCPVQDYKDKVIMPGLVDSHVHINEPGRTEWEGFNTATQAAAAGGITALVDMPLNCIPVTTTKAAFQEKLDSVDDKLWVDCGFWGGVIPQNIDDLDELLNAGVLGVKSFLIDSGIAEFPNVEAKDIRAAMPILAKHDVPYLIHAELDCGNFDHVEITKEYNSFLASRPKSWENEAISLMVDMARESKQKGDNCKVHIVHLSSDEALDTIEQAKKEGLRFSAETCPHYLTIASETIPDGKTLFKCCPPIRENKNREHLWQAITDGRLDFIVSDHSPCTPELKHIDTGDIEKAWGGISALQFGISLIWTEAKERGFSLVDITRLMSTETAKFAGLDSVKGAIKVGNHADFLVFDPDAEFTITNEMIKHRHNITPYAGRKVTGQVLHTYVRGHHVYQQDEFINEPKGRPLLKGRLKG